MYMQPHTKVKAARSRRYSVFVAEPVARILGDSEVFIDVGSVLNLTCVVDDSPEKPAFILWFHGDQVNGYEFVLRCISRISNCIVLP